MFSPKVKAFSSFALLSTLTTICTAGPIRCLTDRNWNSTLERLVECFDGYTVPRDHYTCATYATAQPHTINEAEGWTAAVTYLLDHANGTCALVPFSHISTFYTVSRFTDSITGGTYCVLHETNAVGSPEHYERGWGLFITPAFGLSAFIRPLHFSAPHPVADQGTAVQAAAIFQRTFSKTLLIEGRHRHALSNVSASGQSCFHSCQGDTVLPAHYDATDGAHDSREPFHHAIVAIHSWQASHGGCPLSRCSFIQWHGKNDSTCPRDNAFLSSGFADSSCYSNTTLPVNRIKAQLDLRLPLHFPRRYATPAVNPTCTALAATDNIFGRYVNGVRSGSAACTTAPPPCGGHDFGTFVHIEQNTTLRNPVNWVPWADVILGAFPVPIHIPTPEHQEVVML